MNHRDVTTFTADVDSVISEKGREKVGCEMITYIPDLQIKKNFMYWQYRAFKKGQEKRSSKMKDDQIGYVQAENGGTGSDCEYCQRYLRSCNSESEH